MDGSDTEMRSELQEAYRRINRLQNLLARYGRHDHNCPAKSGSNIDPRCSCGLSPCSEEEGAGIRVRSDADTPEGHKQRHIELHAALDELVADWISHTESLPSASTVLELMRWSYGQTLNPTEPKV